MKLKKCTCGKEQTTKNAKFIGKGDPTFGKKMLYFNCLSCNSTFVVLNKKDRRSQKVAA